MTVLLKIMCGAKISIIELTPEPIVLGRSPDVNFTVDDPQCSGKHCQFKLINNGTVLKDLESKNGTYVNGSIQKETVIYLGDDIRIGSTKLSLDDSKMNEDELSFHTLNVTRKQTQMLKLDQLGLDRSSNKIGLMHKAKALSPRELALKTPVNPHMPWWKKILSFIFKK